jgi:hypothetical protein
METSHLCSKRTKRNSRDTPFVEHLERALFPGITTPPLDISVSSLGVRQTFSLEHRSKNRGSMILEGEIAQHSRGPSSIDAVLRTTDFTLWASPELFGPAFGVAVSGEATLQGPLDAEQLSGTSNFTLHVKGKKNESPFHGDLQVEKGVLTGQPSKHLSLGSLQTTIPLQERSEETPAHLSLSVKKSETGRVCPRCRVSRTQSYWGVFIPSSSVAKRRWRALADTTRPWM